MKPLALASSHTGRRGHDVRHASMTSAYGLGCGPIHLSRSSISASTGSDIGGSAMVLVCASCRLVQVERLLRRPGLLAMTALRGGDACGMINHLAERIFTPPASSAARCHSR